MWVWETWPSLYGWCYQEAFGGWLFPHAVRSFAASSNKNTLQEKLVPVPRLHLWSVPLPAFFLLSCVAFFCLLSIFLSPSSNIQHPPLFPSFPLPRCPLWGNASPFVWSLREQRWKLFDIKLWGGGGGGGKYSLLIFLSSALKGSWLSRKLGDTLEPNYFSTAEVNVCVPGRLLFHILLLDAVQAESDNWVRAHLNEAARPFLFPILTHWVWLRSTKVKTWVEKGAPPSRELTHNTGICLFFFHKW